MPRSNARRTIARAVPSGRSWPKFCQRPSEIAGNCKPLRPEWRYDMRSYRLSAGTYVTAESLNLGRWVQGRGGCGAGADRGGALSAQRPTRGLARRKAAKLRTVLPRECALGERNVVPEPRGGASRLPADALAVPPGRSQLLAVHPGPGARAV